MPKSKTVEHGPSMGEMTTTTSSNSLPANRAGRGATAGADENLAALRSDAYRRCGCCAGEHRERSEGEPERSNIAANSLLDRSHGKPPQAVAVKTESNGDAFVRLWRYLTVGEGVPEAKDVTD